MKVGDYVRFDGEIAKIRDIKRYKTKENIYVFDRILDLNEDRSCNDNTIYNSQWQYFDNVKSSPNIIDLIEVGDILVIKDFVDDACMIFNDIYLIQNETQLLNIKSDLEKNKNKKLYSIVTKEQFSSMEYKVN